MLQARFQRSPDGQPGVRAVARPHHAAAQQGIEQIGPAAAGHLWQQVGRVADVLQGGGQRLARLAGPQPVRPGLLVGGGQLFGDRDVGVDQRAERPGRCGDRVLQRRQYAGQAGEAVTVGIVQRCGGHRLAQPVQAGCGPGAAQHAPVQRADEGAEPGGRLATGRQRVLQGRQQGDRREGLGGGGCQQP